MAEARGATQVSPSGVRARRARRRATLVAGGALAVGAAALALALLRPLPSGGGGIDVAIPSASTARDIGDAIAERQERLARLTRAGNVFAPDRLPWRNDDADAVAIDDEDVEPETPTDTPEPALAATPVITLTERPTAAAKKSRDALDLLGVFESGDDRFAMIRGGESDRRNDVELYRERDVFFAETWRVLRIVTEHDYVILEHLGQGDIVALSMYDTEIPSIAAAPSAAQEGPAVASATAEEAGAHLTEAGIDQGDVDEVLGMLRALERGEDITPPDDAPVVVADAPSNNEAPKPRQPGAAPEMPPALAGLLRSMAMDARKSREKNDEPEEDESPN